MCARPSRRRPAPRTRRRTTGTTPAQPRRARPGSRPGGGDATPRAPARPPLPAGKRGRRAGETLRGAAGPAAPQAAEPPHVFGGLASLALSGLRPRLPALPAGPALRPPAPPRPLPEPVLCPHPKRPPQAFSEAGVPRQPPPRLALPRRPSDKPSARGTVASAASVHLALFSAPPKKRPQAHRVRPTRLLFSAAETPPTPTCRSPLCPRLHLSRESRAGSPGAGPPSPRERTPQAPAGEPQTTSRRVCRAILGDVRDAPPTSLLIPVSAHPGPFNKLVGLWQVVCWTPPLRLASPPEGG